MTTDELCEEVTMLIDRLTRNMSRRAAASAYVTLSSECIIRAGELDEEADAAGEPPRPRIVQ